MWFEVNVRLSEVTDLKWPHGTEWQCGNSTLAMTWPNHVQILSFASMASREGAVKHGFVSKIAGDCSPYDVIAPWPDLTWSIFFLPKVAQGLIHKVPQNPAALRAAVFSLYAKNLRGGLHHPPVRARVNPRLTGVSAERHWPGGGGRITPPPPQANSQTNDRSETDEAALERSRRDGSEELLKIFLKGHVSGEGQVKGQNWAFQHFGSQNRQLAPNRPKLGRNTLKG